MLEEKLNEDYKSAMKEKDEIKVSTIRMLRSAIKNYMIEKIKKEISDEDIHGIIAKQIKQRREAIEEFKKGNRSDLVAKEQKELEILESYAPPQLSQADLEALIDKIVKTTGIQSRAEMGKVMKLVMEEVKGRGDGKLISSLVAGKLK